MKAWVRESTVPYQMGAPMTIAPIVSRWGLIASKSSFGNVDVPLAVSYMADLLVDEFDKDRLVSRLPRARENLVDELGRVAIPVGSTQNA